MFRVLIVENSADIVLNMTRDSIDLGCVCRTVIDIDDFKTSLKTFSPDLVILRLAPDRKSGLDFIVHLANAPWAGHLAITCPDDAHRRDRMEDLALALGLRLVGSGAVSDNASEIGQILKFIISRRAGGARRSETSPSPAPPDNEARRRASNG